jgi:uncharacterized coiled-coil DUF342 family protein
MDDKSAYKQKFEARLKQWAAEIDKLEAKAAEARADARLQYQSQIKELRGKQDEAVEKLQKLSAAQGEAWKDLKSGVESAWDALGKAVQNAASRFG